MKLWDSLTTCLMVLSAVHAGPQLRSRRQSASAKRRGRAADAPLDLPPVQIRVSLTSAGVGRAEADAGSRGETAAGAKQCKSPWCRNAVPNAPNPSEGVICIAQVS